MTASEDPRLAKGPLRKAEHIALALGGRVESRVAPGWDDIGLVHEALPELDIDEVGLGTEFLGRRLRAPLVIAGMTGGHPDGAAINAALGRAAERHGLAIGVGSQRIALADSATAPTYAAAREAAPGALVIANIGAAQLIKQGDQPALSDEDLHSLIDMVAADALAIHLNFVEEAIQPEGDRCTRGCAEAIRRVAEVLEVPVIVKETGAGMSRQTAERLKALGVAALDVGGAGGTSFALVELARARAQGDESRIAVGEMLADWGIPTAVAVRAAVNTGIPVIATGGIRSGLHAAKAIALGATAVGVGRPLLQAASESDEALDRWIERFLSELRVVLQMTGSADLHALRGVPLVIGGRTRDWIHDLGYTD